MTRRVQCVLLCEDKQHEAFARRFLNELRWETRALRVVKAPVGIGSGEQFVRRRFPEELRAHRSRPVDQLLVVLIDGDDSGAAKRIAQLDEACREANVAKRTDDERVMVLVPTWNIETWLAYLDGEAVSEEASSYPRLRKESDCRRHVTALAKMCQDRKWLAPPAPPSLELACKEYRSRLNP